jgi:primosomal protein N' (replication factor Y)
MSPPSPTASGNEPARAFFRCQVAVELPQHSGLMGPLDYLSSQCLPAGQVVRVPLGKRTMTGVVWQEAISLDAEDTESLQRLRLIEEVFADLPPLNASWLALMAFAAKYYQRGLGEMAVSVLPPELRQVTALQLSRKIHKCMKQAQAAEPDMSGLVEPTATHEAGPTLSDDQQAVMQQFMQHVHGGGRPQPQATQSNSPPGPAPALLFGTTGSGKTEIFLRTCAQVLEQGQQVLVLVPEINLTPQLEARFAHRFGKHRMVSLHSGLTTAQRTQNWLHAHMGLARLVLGTRLAVMASMPRLGLILVDEEHDPSYKSQDGARYSARDLAVWRARHEGIALILASATPSLETWHACQTGRYVRWDMRQRIGAGQLPTVRLVDTSRQSPEERRQPVSAEVLAALQACMARGEQSLVFLNRRGYAPVLHCGACGWKSGCPHCSAWRVFHKSDRTLRCHHCGATQAVPKACPECGNLDLQAMGRGTEQLEEQLTQMLRHADGRPARILRLDADSTRQKGRLEGQLLAVHEGEVDVLVGTQMITKGHDFRCISLVVALNADQALFSQDFRAPERLFALLMQAAGRAGRNASLSQHSQMLVQTAHATHPLFAALLKHDYEAFAGQQLLERQQAGLPPFAHLVLLRCEAPKAQAALAFLEAAALALQQLPIPSEWMAQVLVYPPIPMQIARIADMERAQMLVESPHRGVLLKLLPLWVDELNRLKLQAKGPDSRVARWALDIDPLAI